MPGVLRELAEHKLDLNPGSKPVKQRLRWFSPDKKAAFKKEITNLLAVKFIREILHPNWLANPILIQKKNLKEWRMCIDYTDLNKHCPKDPFGLPRINQIVAPRQGQPFCPSLIATWAIIKLPSAKKIKARHPSSPCLVPTVTQPYPLG